MHNNLYKHPQQIILIMFLKSKEDINKSVRPVEFDHYTEPTHCVNLYFRKFSRQATIKQSQA